MIFAFIFIILVVLYYAGSLIYTIIAGVIAAVPVLCAVVMVLWVVSALLWPASWGPYPFKTFI